MSTKTDPGSDVSFQVLEPFTPNEYADVIIRSGDGHDFHIIKAFLSLCSPFFKDLFSLPQPPTASRRDVKCDLPIVEISESGAITDVLLRNIYPVDPPALVNDSLCSSVLSAARKYDMKRVIDAGKRHINELCSGDDESVLRAYVLACAHRLEAEARSAAFMSLRSRLGDPSLVHTLYSLPGRAVACLFIYHGKVGNQIAELVSNAPDLTMDIVDAITCDSCMGYPSYSDGFPRLRAPLWWDSASRGIIDAVYTEGPLSAAALSRETFEDLDFRCDACKAVLLRSYRFEEFVREVRTEMERVASEVEFEIPWET